MTPCDKTILVEFLGLPGAGKSSLSLRVGEELSKRGVHVNQSTYDLSRAMPGLHRYLRKAGYFAREILGHIRHAGSSTRAILATRQASLAEMGRVVFNFLYMCGLMRRSSRLPGVHLFDQGLFQALWSIRFRAEKGPFREALTPIVGTLPLPDAVVLVETSADRILSRLKSRPGQTSRLERLPLTSEGELLAAVEALTEVRALLESSRETRKAMLVLTVNNNTEHDLEESVASVAQAVHRSCSGR